MHYLYIIHSKKIDRFYIGETSDIKNRLVQHNTHYFSNSFTKSASDWEMRLEKELENRVDALYLERFIKRMKSKKFIEKVIENPLILDDILNKR